MMDDTLTAQHLLANKTSKNIVTTRADTKVGDLMTRNVIVVEPERTLNEVEAIMKQNHVRHLPVAGQDTLLGLISIGDVLAYHAAANKQMVHHLTEYIYGRH